MTDAPKAGLSEPDTRAAALLARFERAGYRRIEPPLLQPAEPFLDLSGEDIRRRMFLTSDMQGRELCLRPDLTIPVSREYLESSDAGTSAGFCYLGPVFRHRDDAPSEFKQAGIESFGRRDTAAADAEMVWLGIEATAHYGIAAPDIRLGDVALFAALMAALDLPPVWKRRLIKDFNRLGDLQQDLDAFVLSTAQVGHDYRGVLSALAGSDPKAAHALVTDLLSIAGITAVGGRSVDEIADRFLEQAALGATSGLPHETRQLIQRFLSIAGHPDDAAAEIRALMSDANRTIDAALDLFETRTGFMAARGVDLGRIRFSTAFRRGVDYYTGVVFELHDPEHRNDRQLVGGGRYDDLISRLNPKMAIPAVGFAVWIDRLAALRAER
jgi:ATP phosphoribosyltransferase regulatory subunit